MFLTLQGISVCAIINLLNHLTANIFSTPAINYFRAPKPAPALAKTECKYSADPLVLYSHTPIPFDKTIAVITVISIISLMYYCDDCFITIIIIINIPTQSVYHTPVSPFQTSSQHSVADNYIDGVDRVRCGGGCIHADT